MQKYAHVKGSNPFSPFPLLTLLKIKIMASQKKRNNQSNTLNIAAPKLILSTTSYVSIEQSPHEI